MIVLPLQVNSLSIDSFQVSASTSGSLEKQQNLPLKITLRPFTDAVCGQHDLHHYTVFMTFCHILGVKMRENMRAIIQKIASCCIHLRKLLIQAA